MIIDPIRQEDSLKARSVEFTLMPETWESFAGERFPCAWHMTKLDVNGKNAPFLTCGPGIYTLLVIPNIAAHPACSYLMYVGQTKNLRKRFSNYLVTEKKNRRRPKVFRLLNVYDGHIWFCFTQVDITRLDEYEDALMKAYIPPVNGENRLPAEFRSTIGAF